MCADRALTSPINRPLFLQVNLNNHFLTYSQGHTSYLPRRSYLPASFDLNDAPSSAFALEDLEYASLPQSFLPPRLDPETRYRRALYELEAAEQDYQADIALERARRAAAIRRRAVAEAARREHEIALYAEIERINRARALQGQVEEGFAQRQCPLRTQASSDRAHCGGPALMRAVYGDAERDSVPRFFEGRNSCSQPTPTHSDNETLTLGDLLGLFTGVLDAPVRQCASSPQGPTQPTPSSSHPQHRAEPQDQPQSPKQMGAEANLSNILEFIHSFAAQARGAAGGEQSTHEVRSFIWRVCIPLF